MTRTYMILTKFCTWPIGEGVDHIDQWNYGSLDGSSTSGFGHLGNKYIVNNFAYIYGEAME